MPRHAWHRAAVSMILCAPVGSAVWFISTLVWIRLQGVAIHASCASLWAQGAICADPHLLWLLVLLAEYLAPFSCLSSFAPISHLPSLRCYVPAPVRSQNTTLRTDVLAVLHVSYMVHRALWLMMTPGEEDGTSTGSIVDALLPKALEAQACPLVNEMGNEAVAALQVNRDCAMHV